MARQSAPTRTEWRSVARLLAMAPFCSYGHRVWRAAASLASALLLAGCMPAAAPIQSEALRLADGLSRDFLYHHRLCPAGFGAEGELLVAARSDAYLSGLDTIARAYAVPVRLTEASADELEVLIERLVAATDRSTRLDHRNLDANGDSETDVRELAVQPPVVRYVNLLLREGLEAGASDIHLTSEADGEFAVRFRRDGVLVAPAISAPSNPEAVVSRLKLLAELDISERRRPQDGRIRIRGELGALDLRVSCVPTLHGESVVLRLLDRGHDPQALESLGLAGARLKLFRSMVQRRHGLVLVTGPTGSGKTTTLYAALRERRRDTERVVTVEDPVEYRVDGVVQVPTHASAGVTMSSALRAILRQDPDVIMVGELRDHETAELAVQAALTGHLVLSTLHTTDAVGAIPRLLDLGIPAYLVAATLEGVLAQRLVRRLCQECRPTRTSGELYGTHCESCRGTGYSGRVGVFETFMVSAALRDAIAPGATRSTLMELISSEGFVDLHADAEERVAQGVTTADEVARVLGV